MQLAHMLHEAKEPLLLPIRQAVIDGFYDESPDEADKAKMKAEWLEDGGTLELFEQLFEKK